MVRVKGVLLGLKFFLVAPLIPMTADAVLSIRGLGNVLSTSGVLGQVTARGFLIALLGLISFALLFRYRVSRVVSVLMLVYMIPLFFGTAGFLTSLFPKLSGLVGTGVSWGYIHGYIIMLLFGMYVDRLWERADVLSGWGVSHDDIASSTYHHLLLISLGFGLAAMLGLVVYAFLLDNWDMLLHKVPGSYYLIPLLVVVLGFFIALGTYSPGGGEKIAVVKTHLILGPRFDYEVLDGEVPHLVLRDSGVPQEREIILSYPQSGDPQKIVLVHGDTKKILRKAYEGKENGKNFVIYSDEGTNPI